MSYSIMAGGKRLRPILCLAAADAVAGKPHEALRAACALEFIHTYSLIHDDLPAMDNDDLRRGKKTCHVAFDEATAILAGDAMLTMAFQILSTDDSKKKTAQYLQVIYTIATAAGHKGMVAGQMRDIASEGRTLALKDLKEIYRLKTGALIEASICTGAIIADASRTQMHQLSRYAKNIGLAFQITDDILNVEGDPAVTGKASGTDEFRQKATYPALIGVSKSFETAEKLVRYAIQSIKGFDDKSDPLRAIADYVVKRKK
ncbi:MAG: polyprenyl synthetase family protein [Desulfobacterales bacterium]|nr:polyprenyl synthetase family protein [Desulfobacterales bacterium]